MIAAPPAPAADPSPVKLSFPPVVAPRTRLLILGSLPGEASLRRGEYYAHPRNQFWRLMEGVIGAPLAGSPYPDRLAALLGAGVGLWDVVRSARRVGSLDAAIRDHTANELGALIATLPALAAVAFNGATASAIGRRRLGPETGFAQVTLPSSSPTHAGVPFGRKAEQWARLRAFVEPAA
jgi:hypoxanthine-DNA glycosylase